MQCAELGSAAIAAEQVGCTEAAAGRTLSHSTAQCSTVQCSTVQNCTLLLHTCNAGEEERAPAVSVEEDDGHEHEEDLDEAHDESGPQELLVRGEARLAESDWGVVHGCVDARGLPQVAQWGTRDLCDDPYACDLRDSNRLVHHQRGAS